MKKTPLLLLGIALIIALIWVIVRQKNDPQLQHISGQTMGAIIYNVKYLGDDIDLKDDIDRILKEFNQSQSTYITDSEISMLNKEGSLDIESAYFYPVLNLSQEVFEVTNGAYDPSVGPLVQAWGFGPDKQIPNIDSAIIDSLRALSGFGQVQFSQARVEVPTNFQLDFSAIAKGYAVDLVAELLEANGFENYLVEIGGEVRCSGFNEKEGSWSLGIEDQLVEQNERRILAIVKLRNKALATSGN